MHVKQLEAQLQNADPTTPLPSASNRKPVDHMNSYQECLD